MLASAAWGQACLTGEDLEAPVRAKLEAAAAKYFDLAAKGDVGGLKDQGIPRVSADFSGIAAAGGEHQSSFAKGEGGARSPFELNHEGDGPPEGGWVLLRAFRK